MVTTGTTFDLVTESRECPEEGTFPSKEEAAKRAEGMGPEYSIYEIVVAYK